MILIKNIFLNRFDSIIKIRVIGKNINNYIKKIIKYKINILNLEYVSYKEVILTVSYKDYLKLLEHKTIYEIEVIDKLGRLKIKDNVKKNTVLLVMFIIGIGILLLLSNVIFDIEVIHAKSSIRNLIMEELENHGISKYKFKKSYKELEKIEEEILEDNKDSLEWIEILVSGTKYTVRVQERVINKEQEDYNYQDLVAGKTAILTTIIANRGEKVKEVNDYVNKGDVVVTGTLVHSDGTTTYTMALGAIYGEVWYTMDIEYPYVYYEEKVTNRKEDVYVFNFLGHKFDLFSKYKFKNYKSSDKILLNNYLIPISFTKQSRQEVEIIESIYTEDEALNKALGLAKEKLLNSNNKIKEVSNIKILNKEITENTIKLKLFVSVIEDITVEKEIVPNDVNLESNGSEE